MHRLVNPDVNVSLFQRDKHASKKLTTSWTLNVMSTMSENIVLFIVGGLATTVVTLFGYLVHKNENRIAKLESWHDADQARMSKIELQIAERLASIEAKLEQLIER